MSLLRRPRARHQSADTPAVCYVVSEYPALSHTFIRREVEAVRTAGVAVETVSVRRADEASLLSSADREAARTSRWIQPPAASLLLRGMVLPALRHPAAFASTMRATTGPGPAGLRHRLWRFFYFVEGMLLWRMCADSGLRHVHAHFANVGADVSRVAAVFGSHVDGAGTWSWSFTMHGCDEFYDLTRFGVAAKIRSARFVAAVSDYTKAQLLRIVDEGQWSKIHVVRCGIDLERFRPVGPPPGKDRPLRVLFVGRMVTEKGLPVLIDAVDELVRRGVDVAVTLVGDGELRSTWEARVAGHGLGGVARFTGAVAQDEILGYYQDADVFCMASFGEGLPVVLMEAMACGLPVVAPWISGIPELVADEKAGLLVPPARPDLLADALERLARDPQLRHRLGEQGRQRVLQDHDVVVSGKTMAGLFLAVGEGR